MELDTNPTKPTKCVRLIEKSDSSVVRLTESILYIRYIYIRYIYIRYIYAIHDTTGDTVSTEISVSECSEKVQSTFQDLYRRVAWATQLTQPSSNQKSKAKAMVANKGYRDGREVVR